MPLTAEASFHLRGHLRGGSGVLSADFLPQLGFRPVPGLRAPSVCPAGPCAQRQTRGPGLGSLSPSPRSLGPWPCRPPPAAVRGTRSPVTPPTAPLSEGVETPLLPRPDHLPLLTRQGPAGRPGDARRGEPALWAEGGGGARRGAPGVQAADLRAFAPLRKVRSRLRRCRPPRGSLSLPAPAAPPGARLSLRGLHRPRGRPDAETARRPALRPPPAGERRGPGSRTWGGGRAGGRVLRGRAPSSCSPPASRPLPAVPLRVLAVRASGEGCT